MNKMIGALGICLLMAAGVQAGSMKNVSVGRVADVKGNGSGERVVPTVLANRIMGYHTAAGNMQLVYVFKMTGAADASKITAANFSVTQLSAITGFNIDAKVIRTASTAKVLISDYQATAAMLMEDFSDNSAKGAKALCATGQAALVSYLKTNWVEGGYLFIGLQTDPVTIVSAKNQFVKFADDGVLSVTVAP